MTSQRILFVHCCNKQGHEMIDQLSHENTVVTVHSIDEALNYIGQGPFDWIFCDATHFPPLGKKLIAYQASDVLERIGQCVCIVDLQGSTVWSNNHFLNLDEEVRSKVKDCCQEMVDAPQGTDSNALGLGKVRQFQLRASDDRYFEVNAAPIVAGDGAIHQIAANIVDVTEARRLQKRIDAIDRAGRELIRQDSQEISKLQFGERLTVLEDKIIRLTHDLMHFDNFAIWILDKKTHKLELLVNSKLPAEAVEIDLAASPVGNGISGYVASTGRSYICPNVRKDPRYLPGIEGARSSLTVPLWLDDELMGILNVESMEEESFTEDDCQFAEIFGRYIAIALNTLNLLVTERVTTSGVLASNVECEIAAPINDIITDASSLMEEYIGHDDLRHRLQAICDRAMDVKRAVKEVTVPTQAGWASTTSHKDTTDPILAGKRVLLADDEEAIRETLSDILTRLGCEVETAKNGLEATTLLKQHHYDIVLSDIKMPYKSGYDVFATAKDQNAACPVILMTGFGYDPNHSIVRARREGLSAVLFKPFKVDQLLTELHNALQSNVTSS